MLRRNLAYFTASLLLSFNAHSLDLDHSVSGDSEIEDTLGKSTEAGNSPYIINGEADTNVENSKAKGDDYLFNHGVKEVTIKKGPKQQFEDFGYTVPGTFEGQENYLEIDKVKMTKDFRKAASGNMNLTFIKNDFDYQSTDDIINRTIGDGTKSIKGGALHIRNDLYLVKRDLMNLYWSVGSGVSYSQGRGIFKANGQRSDTIFKLWEVPLEVGLGGEVAIANWFKIAGTAGPSALAILQNRSDYQRGEKGKRKYQFSPGYFANAQFKVNLSGFSDETAYELFTSSEITNLYMNLEIRHQSYENFQDPISVSGTSFGVGFTFEYL